MSCRSAIVSSLKTTSAPGMRPTGMFRAEPLSTELSLLPEAVLLGGVPSGPLGGRRHQLLRLRTTNAAAFKVCEWADILAYFKCARCTATTFSGIIPSSGIRISMLLPMYCLGTVAKWGGKVCCFDCNVMIARVHTAGYLSFGPMTQCVVHALKGLACRARVTPASAPASHCQQCSALTSPALHARGCASPSRAR